MNPVVIVETKDIVRNALADDLRDAGIRVVALAQGWDIFLLPSEAASPTLLVTDINHGVEPDGFKLAAAAHWVRPFGWQGRA
jgi:DNA-binding NtrC family response regulator